MGGTRLAKARLAELKKRILHAEEKKKEFSDYISRLKQKYHRGEISYSDFLENFYQKRNGLSLKEWVSHFDDFINDCKKEIRKERIKLLGNYFLFAFLSLAIILIVVLPFFYLKPSFTGFAVWESQNVTTNGSYSEETTGEIQNTSPSHQIGQEQELLPPSENISVINETGADTVPELNITENETQNIPIENFTTNETIQNPINETFTNVTEQNISQQNTSVVENVTVNTTQITPKIRLGEPVRWKKTISSDGIGNATITLPENSENITITKVNDLEEKDVTSSIPITGAVIGNSKENFIFRFLKNIFGRITGRAVDENPQSGNEIEIEIEIDEIQAEYEVEYETPAPYSVETEKRNGKQVKIFGPDTVHYEDVLAFTNLNESLKIISPEKIKIKWVEQNTYMIPDSVLDTDENGVYDYVEWNVPSLSEQTFEIIVITKAEHLDSNRNFISDIYEQVKSLDSIWSEPISDGHFVRVTFEKNLTNEKDITIYPRITSGNPKIEVYENNQTKLIAEFSSLNENEYNKVYLTNLISESQNVFDLEVVGGSLEFDEIVDPSLNQFPNTTTNRAYNGTLNDDTLSINTQSAINTNDYAKITSLDSNSFQIPGASTSADVFLFVNFTNIPSGYTAINVSVWHNSSTSSKTGIALWNFTRSDWEPVLNTSSSTTKVVKSYNITQTKLDDFVSGNEVRAMVFDDSTGSVQLRVDQIWINVTYESAADNTSPALTIDYPQNISYGANISELNYTASDGIMLSACWYSTDNGATNSTPDVTCSNFTNLGSIIGSNTWTVYANDTSNNLNQSSVTFERISDIPQVTINFPQNTTYHLHSDLPLNFNVSLNEVGSAMYSLDDGATNISMAVSNGSIFGTDFNAILETLAEGSYTFKVYANDTTGNWNNTENIVFDLIMENMLVNGTVLASNGTTLNSTVTIIDEGTQNIIYNGTNETQTALVPLNTTYTIEFFPLDIDAVDKVEFNSINFSEINATETEIVRMDEDDATGNFASVFSIKPKYETFDNGTIFFTAKANALFRCGTWNYTNDLCTGNWSLFMDNLVPGDSYNFTFSGVRGYGIINITNATHLDQNLSYISDIFDYVIMNDDQWSEEIPEGHYVKIIFEQNLTNANDINIYPRIVSGTPRIEVYENNQNTSIGTLGPLVSNQYNDFLLVNLTSQSQDIFNLRVVGGSIEIDHIIDPTEIITPQGAADLKLAPLTNTTFALAYINASAGEVLFEVWNTSGVRIGGPFVVNATAINPTISRVDVISINTTDLIFGYTNMTAAGKNASAIFQGFTSAGTGTIAPVVVSNIGNSTQIGTVPANILTQAHAISLSYFTANSTIGYTFVNKSGDKIVMRTFNSTTGAAALAVPAIINPLLGNISYNLSNILDFVTINASAGVVFEYDSGADNDTTFHIVSAGNVELLTDTDIDANVGAWNVSTIPRQPEVAVTSMNNASGKSIVALVWQNASGLRAAVRDEQGVAVANTGTQTIVEDTLTSRPVATEVHNLQTGLEDFVIAWYNRSNTAIVAQVWNYTLNATTTQILVNDSAPAAYINKFIAVVGEDDGSGMSICTGTFVVAYTNSTNSTVFQTYWYNGSKWDGSCEIPPDITAPALNITQPAANNTNSPDNLLDILYNFSDNLGLRDSAWYSNDSFSVNLSLGSGGTYVNITNLTWSQGTHIVRVYVNDTANNLNESSITFTIDSVAPNLNITSPVANKTNTTDINLDILYNVSDATLGFDSCFYGNDTFTVANLSLGSGGFCANITNITWSQGTHALRIYANDTLNNINTSTLTFTVDNVAPALNITSPVANNTNSSDNLLDILYNFSDATLTPDSCWYSNDTFSVANYSLGSGGFCNNLTNTTWSEGIHNIRLYVNDTLNNLNISTITFTIDSVAPSLNITSPAMNNTNATDLLTDILFTISELGTNVESVWYSNDSYSVNLSLGSAGVWANITNVTWSQGTHNVRIYANDSANNVNLSTRTFTADTFGPAINFTALTTTNGTYFRNSIDVNVTVNDSSTLLTGINISFFDSSMIILNSSFSPTSGAYSSFALNFTGLADGLYFLNASANDTLNNRNFSETRSYILDTTAPALNITIPAVNNTNTTDNQQDVNFTFSDALIGMNSCWYSNDTYSVNLSLGSGGVCADLTNITWTNIIHNVTIYVNDTLGNLNYTSITINVSSANEAPTIPTVYNITVQTPTENGFTNVSIFFVASDSNGAVDLVNATANFTINKSGEPERYSANCDPINGSGNSVTYNCSLKMWYFDLAGLWTVNVSVQDVSGAIGVNNSTGFVFDVLTAMQMSPTALSWPEIFANNTINVTSNNDPIIINNTGNDVNDINVNAIDLQGEISTTEYMRSTNFSVAVNLTSDSTGCAGNLMANATDVNVTSGFLNRGNNSILSNTSDAGQQQLYFCLRYLNTSLSAQPYSAHTNFAWTIKTLLSFVAYGAAKKFRKKKKQNERNKIDGDKLLETISLLADEFKEKHRLNRAEAFNEIIRGLRKKYKINRNEILELSEVKKISIPATIFSDKIGILESLVKYMKENLEMSYKEISQELGRDERTIWTAYKKATEKQKEKIEEKETEILLPLSIFKNNNLTTLEAIIIYLKENGMKYSEIGELLNRDQRNIWTVYNRAIKKKR